MSKVKFQFICGLAQALWLLSSNPIHAIAATSDKDAPMQIEADTVTHDEVRQISVFTGNVEIKKGSMFLRGEQVVVRQDILGYQSAKATGAVKPAYFRQSRDAPGEIVDGEGQTIEYTSKTGEIQLSGKALFRRLLNNKVQDEAKGQYIVYNDLTDSFKVDSKTTGSTPKPGERVRIIISPNTLSSKPSKSNPSVNVPLSSSVTPKIPPSGGAK